MLLLLLCILVAVFYVRKRRMRDNRHLDLFKRPENAINPAYISEFAAVEPARELFLSDGIPFAESDEPFEITLFDKEPKFRISGPSLLQHGNAFKFTAAVLDKDVARAEAQQRRINQREVAWELKKKQDREGKVDGRAEVTPRMSLAPSAAYAEIFI